MSGLENHVGMYTFTLDTINSTEYRIALNAETKPIHQQLYHAGPISREVLEERIQTQLDAGIIEPPQTEWASPVILAQKKDRSMRF